MVVELSVCLVITVPAASRCFLGSVQVLLVLVVPPLINFLFLNGLCCHSGIAVLWFCFMMYSSCTFSETEPCLINVPLLLQQAHCILPQACQCQDSYSCRIGVSVFSVSHVYAQRDLHIALA